MNWLKKKKFDIGNANNKAFIRIKHDMLAEHSIDINTSKHNLLLCFQYINLQIEFKGT